MAHELPSTFMRSCTDGTFMCIAKWAFSVTQGMFWALSLIGFSVAIFMATAKLGTTRAFAFAGFVMCMGSIWLAVMGLLAWWLASTLILTGLISLMIAINSEN